MKLLTLVTVNITFSHIDLTVDLLMGRRTLTTWLCGVMVRNHYRPIEYKVGPLTLLRIAIHERY